MRTRLVALLTLILCATHLDAGAGQRKPEPARADPLTASISGRVTTQTGGAIRRAEVRAINEVGLTRFATTDTEGRFTVRDLPAGTFTVHVSKSGFVPLYFGQRRPFERRGTIKLTAGERGVADVRLPRAGAITGRIFDSTGEPVMGVRVQALRRRMVDGQRGLQAFGAGDTTDDTGAYRLYGLPPGDYYVTAVPRRVDIPAAIRVTSPLNGVVSVPSTIPTRGTPIYYPGTANREEAQRIAVDVSGEARADLVLQNVRTSRITGTVLTSAGTPAVGAMISLLARDLDFQSGGDVTAPLQIQDDAAADGTFELTGVPPGSFALRVQTRPNVSAILDIPDQRLLNANIRPSFETAVLPITVVDDITGLLVATAPSGSIQLSVVADQGVSAALPNGIRVGLRGVDRGEAMAMIAKGGVGGATMTLSLGGPARVTVDELPANWAVKSVFLDNEDVTDRPIDVRGRQQVPVRVVLTDRVTEVIGSISTASFGDTSAASQATVVVFADDESKWTFPSRFLRSVRAGDKGTFEMTALPPENYLAVAVDYLEDGEETDPEFLKRMRERATRFSVREGERRTLDLRLIQR